MKRAWAPSALAPLALALAACTASHVRPQAGIEANAADDNLKATLWMQQAAEYQASVRGIYAAARVSLDKALADPGWNALPVEEVQPGFENRPAAIIVDADETLIDNSRFQARGVIEGQGYSRERWQAWVNARKAEPMPGALAFARYVAERGVTIFYVTNRDAPQEYEATVAHLRALGFPVDEDAGNVMLRGDPRVPPGREKGERRRHIGREYRVLLMLGDNLGDFLDGIHADGAARERLMAPYQSWWGERWFMLPNPSYGSWEEAILQRCAPQTPRRECLRSALRHGD